MTINKPTKIKEGEPIYFASDAHINHSHESILAYWKADSAKEATAKTIARWNERVPEDAIVYFLGDFCLHDPDGSQTMNALRSMNFREMRILWGNHNSGMARVYRKAVKTTLGGQVSEKRLQGLQVYPAKLSIGQKQIVFLGHYHEIKQGEDLFVLCHFALRNWRHNGKGSYMICGHSHGNDQHIAMKSGQGRILDVGFESTGGPISIEKAKALLSPRHVIAYDHH